jgi:pantetheine-phosphate adenylyltransferase
MPSRQPAGRRRYGRRFAIPDCWQLELLVTPVSTCIPRGQLNRTIAIYPGSFDPPTNGHLDLIERGSKIFDELVVAILRNPEKAPLFSVAERTSMLERLTEPFRNVRVDTFDGLMVDYALRVNATCILRGIRAISDYEYELQMALMNRKLCPQLETVFMMPADKYSYLSSRLVREVAQVGGAVTGLVPELVEQGLRAKLEPAYKFGDMAEAEKRESRKSKSRKRS